MSATEFMRADVVVEAQTGTAKLGLEELRREFTQTTGQMSTEALRAAVAQEKLDKAIARHGPASTQAKQAELAFRREIEQTTKATNAESVALERTDRELGKVLRGAAAGSGVFHGLGRSVAFASGTFLGSAGLVFGIKASVDQAVQQSKIIANLRNALEAGGRSWSQYGDEIQSATAKLKEQSAFDDEELYASLQLLLRSTGSVTKALQLNALAADVARGRNMGLVQAATLLVRVQAGQVGSLRRLGIEVAKGISGQKALEAVQRQYAGSAQDYANSAAGSQQEFRIAIEDTEKAVGRGLLPAIQDLNKEIVPWISNTANQKRIQDDVNSSVQAGEKIVKGLAEGIGEIKPAIDTAIHALGGLEHAAEDALIVALLLRAKRAAGGFGLIQAASARARTQIVTDATAESTAVAGVGTVAQTTATRIRSAFGRGLLGGAGVAGLAAGGGNETIGNLSIAAILAASGNPEVAAGYLGVQYLPGLVKNAGTGITATGKGANGSPYNSGSPGDLEYQAAYARGRGNQAPAREYEVYTTLGPTAGAAGDKGIGRLAALGRAYALGLQAFHSPGKTYGIDGLLPGRVSGTGRGVVPLTPAQQRAQALAGAAGAPNSPAAVSAYQGQAEYDRNALAFLDQRRQAGKITNAQYITAYTRLTQDLQQQQAALQSVADAAAEAQRKADEKKKAAASREAAAAAKRQREYEASVRAQAAELRNAATASGRFTTTAPGGKPASVDTSKVMRTPAETELLAFYTREAHDKRLSREQRAKYQQLILQENAKERAEAKKIADEEKKTRQALVDAFKSAAGTLGVSRQTILQQNAAQTKTDRQIREQILQNRLAEARLGETQAGDSAAKIAAARKREIAAYQAILKLEQEEGKHLTGLAKQQNIAEQIATRQAIAELQKGKTPSAKGGAPANEAQFLSSFQQIVSGYAPNAFPTGKATTHLYELVHETRKTNKHLARISTSSTFPMSKLNQLESAAVYG